MVLLTRKKKFDINNERLKIIVINILSIRSCIRITAAKKPKILFGTEMCYYSVIMCS